MAWRKTSGIHPTHRRNNSFSRFLSDLLGEKESNVKIPHFDAEDLTAQERLSRMLHTPKSKSKIPTAGFLFEHFLVVGAEAPSLDRKAEPKILFQYPKDIPMTFPGVCDFCFPSGVPTIIAPPPNEPKKPPHENSFVFLITTEQANNLYGICVYKEYIIEDTSTPMDRLSANGLSNSDARSISSSPIPSSPTTGVPPFPMPSSRSLVSTTRCLCFISKFPFFRLHFEVLYSILEIEASFHSIEQQAARLSSSTFSGRGEDESVDENTDALSSYSTNSPPSLADSVKLPNYNILSDDNEVTIAGEIAPSAAQEESTLKKLKRIYENTLRDSLTSSSQTPTPTNMTYTIYDSVFMPKAWQDENQIQSINILDRYRNRPIPISGHMITFQACPAAKKISFARPSNPEAEEEMLLGEWGVPIALQALGHKLFFVLLGAVLLERKIVFVSPDLRILSALVLSWLPLIRPFNYQSVLIPILPNTMFSFLEAPVPFIVGVVEESAEIPTKDVIVVDVQKRTITAPTPIPTIPDVDSLKKKVEREMEKLKITKSTKFLDQRDLGRIVKLFTEFFNSLFQNFHQHTLRDLTDPQKPITVFLKESFLSSCYEEENLFLIPFLETQIFFHFSDECLRKRDMHEIPLVKSQSAPTGLHYIRDSGGGNASILSKSPSDDSS